jgi:hypothetical protein
MLRAASLRSLLSLALVAIVALTAACTGGDEEAGVGANDAIGPGHVHGLGVNPADGALYIATHNGLFRMPRGSDTSDRVGESLHDIMGFAVVGPDRFIGSGHPGPGDELPSLLGLIASSDAGRTWEPVSLLGEADFHALRADGPRVIGYDASGGRLMRSDDAGRTWTTLATPDSLHAVAADPGRSERLLASGSGGLFGSTDGGTSWTAVPGPPALLAWPASDALYAIGADGTVAASADAGRSWTAAGALPGDPVAATAAGREALVVALSDGRIVSSPDGGRSWSDGAWAGHQG